MSQHHSSSYSSSARGRGYKHTSSTSFSNPNAPTPTREYYGSGGGSSVSSSHHQQARHRDDDYDRYSRSYQGNDASSYRQGRPPSSPSSYYHDERKRAEPSYQHYKDPVHDDRSNVSNTNVSSHHNYHSENYNYRKFYDHNRPSHGYRDDKISRKEDHYQNRPTSHPASGNYSQQSSSNYQQRHDDRYHPPSKSPSRNIPASSHVTPLTNNETRTKNQQTETKRKSVVAFKDQHDERTITPDMKRVKSEKSSIMEPSEKLSATNKGTFNNVSNIVTQQQIAPPPNEEEIIKQTLIMEEQLIKANDENEVKRKREERKKKFQQMEKEKQEASPHPQSEDSIASDDENQAFVAPLSSDAFKSGGNSFYYELEQERNKLQERSAIDDEINESSKEPAAVSLHDDTTNVKENEGESSPFIDMFGASTDELVQALAEPSAHVNTAVDLYDDPEGYYRFTIGEVMNDRYKIEAFLGQGVFSSVVQASDKLAKDPQSQRVAIKIIRSSETMRKAGTKELNIISMLMEKDPNDESHIIRMLDHFTYRNHLCLVFELLEMNLRDVLKHYGRREGKQVGISMDAVRVYTKQLLVALKHIQDCNILHADIKPDNMLVHPSHTKIKLSDLGSASDVSENSITPYLVSRFYRAPEIILGMKYSYPIDMWSVACTVFELYTGKILFPSQNNNDAIRLMMELKGKFSNKVLKKCAFRETHFDFNGDGAFLFREWDPLTKKIKTRKLYYQKSVTDLKAMLLNSMISNQHLQDEKAMKEERKLVLMLHDFLDKALILDPSKRLTVSDALKHPFVTETATTIHTVNLVNV